MSKLLVHLHLFYQEQVDYFIDKFKNIQGCDWDLLITYNSIYDESVQAFKSFKNDTVFLQVENIGYDVWPFIYVIKHYDLSPYSYVMKIHTKNTKPEICRINGLRLTGERWRDMLIDSMLGSKTNFQKFYTVLENNPNCGLVYPYEVGKKRSKGLPEDQTMLRKEAERIGVGTLEGKFVAGTMFMARVDAFSIIKNADIKAEMFDGYINNSHMTGTLAHVYERLLCYAVYQVGYESKGIVANFSNSLAVVFYTLTSPILSNLFSIERDENREKILTVLGMRFRLNKNKTRFGVKFSIFINGHILNPFWKSRMERRKVRGEVIASKVCAYLDRYVPYFESLPEDEPVRQEKERIFSIWFQGEEVAPPIVKACWRSMRKHCKNELVILDSKTIFDWITLPDYIVDKWKRGKIGYAHFADICRIELLYKYGGLWLDSTDYVFADMPEWLMEQDFFVFMSGRKQRGFYSFIQNCFIRSKKSGYLIKAWREAVFTYWKYENSAIDYFVHQLLFRKVVENNLPASRLFEKMPKFVQDPTHTIWFEHASDPYDEELFKELSEAAVFQKTEYKSSNATAPNPGSFAEKLINLNQ